MPIFKHFGQIVKSDIQKIGQPEGALQVKNVVLYAQSGPITPSQTLPFPFKPAPVCAILLGRMMMD